MLPGRPILRVVLNRILGETPPATPVAEMVPGAVVRTVSGNQDLTLVKVKPARRTSDYWAALGGAFLVLVNNVGPQLGVTVNQPVSDAVETVTAFAGLPENSGRVAVALVTVGSLVFLWAKKTFFTHTLTPAAANRAVSLGKAV